MIRLLIVAAMAMAIVDPALGAPSKGKSAKAKPGPTARTVVLDVTGMH